MAEIDWKTESRRFDAVAGPYHTYRPGYPTALVDAIGKNGTIARTHLRVNPVGYIANLPIPTLAGSYPRVRPIGDKGYWPDPLMPQQTFNAKDPRNHPLWITLHAPADAKPGLYEGTIAVTLKAALCPASTVWSTGCPVIRGWSMVPFIRITSSKKYWSPLAS